VALPWALTARLAPRHGATTQTRNREVPPLTTDIQWKYREDSSDLSVINSTMLHDEYGLKDLPPLSGWALDIGAHIGSVTVPLALDHPDLRIIAVEALSDNVEVLRENVANNDLTDRVIVKHAAIAAENGFTEVWSHFKKIEGVADPFLYDNRFIGNIYNKPGKHPEAEFHRETVEGITLSTLLEDYDILDVVFTKTDCEGGEWALLEDPAVAALHYIVGEYHDRTENDLFETLHLTHDVTTFPAAEEHDGGIGLFWAVAR